jgi:hypothetical protein
MNLANHLEKAYFLMRELTLLEAKKMYRIFLALTLGFWFGCSKEQPTTKIEVNNNLDLGAGATQAFVEPLLSTYQTCDLLMAHNREDARQKIRAQMDKWPTKAPPNVLPPMPPVIPIGPVSFDDAPTSNAAPTSGPIAGNAPPPSSSAPDTGEGVDFSGTNNQEKGVDEADIIKTDGHYFYVLNNNRLEILRIDQGGQLNLAGSLQLERGTNNFLIANDRAFVFASGFLDGYSSRIDVIDLSLDRNNPNLIKTHYFEGRFEAARKIGNKIFVATHKQGDGLELHEEPVLPLDYHSQTPDMKEIIWAEAVRSSRAHNEELIDSFDFLSLVPRKLHKNAAQFERLPLTEEDCSHVFAAKDDATNSYLSLITLDSEDESAVDQQWVRIQDATVYASPEQVIIAANSWWRADRNQIALHRFKLQSDHNPTYADSTTVPGKLLNSFSLSEYQGYVRVATHAGNGPSQTNSLYILGEEEGVFKIISSLEGLAPGERIWAARFSKDRGFLVTFKTVDPLFTLDLSDPKNPKVAGELKVPGVSTYLQDIGHDHLLAVGHGGDESGLSDDIVISLFDVSDFKHPRLAQSSNFAITSDHDDSWNVSSLANNTHLAINYFAPLGLTAVPVMASRYVHRIEEHHWQNDFVSKLQVFNTKAGEELILVGEVDHSSYYNSDDEDAEENSYGISRSYFVGDYLYAFSPNVATATRLSDMVTTEGYLLK